VSAQQAAIKEEAKSQQSAKMLKEKAKQIAKTKAIKLAKQKIEAKMKKQK